MGRLQRKKAPNKKKIRTDVAVSGSDKKSVTGQGPGAPGANSGEIKKKQQSFKKIKAAKGASGKKKNTYIDKAVQFLREVKVELKKVTWPSRKQTIGSTLVVIVLVMIISLFLGVVDIGLSGLVRVVLG
ncbi:MAG: preprotein translocase subunit SecE [Desulfobacteraceae bacterium 4572_123]|nr:MAG: preprotein translocase subunit SecE [Desulfobacteraceae bacterium 4572_123]